MNDWKNGVGLLVISVLICGVFFGCAKKAEPSGVYSKGDGVSYFVFEDDRFTLNLGSLKFDGTWKSSGDGKLTLNYSDGSGSVEVNFDSEKNTITKDGVDGVFTHEQDSEKQQ